MLNIRENINQWPYEGDSGMSAQFYNLDEKKPQYWTECTEKHYWNQLECLPPIRQKQGAFMVGECYSHRMYKRKFQAFYACFVEITFEGEKSPRFFGKICPISEFDPVVYKMEIIDQVFNK